uniref:mRNA decapping enzyme putative n=1 Tax=Albugo laibachii Nc14 TaxID=890382 RepID=F0WGG7_9STRA|nr:mRNA decapping enzyme putative [Albugo laibachii Nc14]|eukprot:CCA20330.1 mRNA decapping enzyme putative [Albugo laibachii Nc14]
MSAIKDQMSCPTNEVLDELQSRFLVNLPRSELTTTERLFFQLEQCYWFYEDFYADNFPKECPHLKFHEFARKMFSHCLLLKPHAENWERMYEEFKTYQSQVPVIGCILLNAQENKLLLVQNWKGTCWNFPRGKVNEKELDIDCARREVMEECGYDVGNALSEDSYLEMVLNKQRIRMYLCRNVAEEYTFAPQTRKEISAIRWFHIDHLPKKTWCVLPFMSRLKRCLSQDKQKNVNEGKIKGILKKLRPSSVPKNRPEKCLNVTRKEKRQTSKRSISTPHARVIGQRSRGHFGTECDIPTSYDHVNSETFGVSTASFSVEDMFNVNERLTGQKFVYDGNPHDFGTNTAIATVSSNHDHQYIEMSRSSNSLILFGNRASKSTSEISDRSESTSSSSSTAHSSTPFGSFVFDTGDIMACVN